MTDLKEILREAVKGIVIGKSYKFKSATGREFYVDIKDVIKKVGQKPKVAYRSNKDKRDQVMDMDVFRSRLIKESSNPMITELELFWPKGAPVLGALRHTLNRQNILNWDDVSEGKRKGTFVLDLGEDNPIKMTSKDIGKLLQYLKKELGGTLSIGSKAK